MVPILPVIATAEMLHADTPALSVLQGTYVILDHILHAVCHPESQNLLSWKAPIRIVNSLLLAGPPGTKPCDQAQCLDNLWTLTGLVPWLLLWEASSNDNHPVSAEPFPNRSPAWTSPDTVSFHKAPLWKSLPHCAPWILFPILLSCSPWPWQEERSI